MSELTKALIQFHKDVDKIEKERPCQLREALRTSPTSLAPSHRRYSRTGPRPYSNLPRRQPRHYPPARKRRRDQQLSASSILSEGRNKTQEWGKAVTYQRQLLPSVSHSGSSWLIWTWMAPCSKSRLSPTEPSPLPSPSPSLLLLKIPSPRKAAAPAADPADQPLMKEEVDAILEILIGV